MNLTRLVCLGLLAEHGARHGHQLRRDVETFKADDWAGVGAGSLHLTLPNRWNTSISDINIVGLLLQIGIWGNGVISFTVGRYVGRRSTASGDTMQTPATVAALSLLPSRRMWKPDFPTNIPAYKYEPDCIGCQQTVSDLQATGVDWNAWLFRALSDGSGLWDDGLRLRQMPPTCL